MQLQAEDVRYPIRAHVAKIVEHINRLEQGLSQFPATIAATLREQHPDAVRALRDEYSGMITQLDILQAKAVAVAVTAKLEQDNEARKAGGKITSEARKKHAGFTEQKVKDEAARLRAEGTPEHKLITAIMTATGYSRTAVTRYLPKK